MGINNIYYRNKGGMVESFMRFIEDQSNKHGWHFELYYSSIMDWCITIGYKSTHPKSGEQLFSIQDCDLNFVLAKAEVEIKEWLTKNKGGY